MTNILRELF